MTVKLAAPVAMPLDPLSDFTLQFKVENHSFTARVIGLAKKIITISLPRRGDLLLKENLIIVHARLTAGSRLTYDLPNLAIHEISQTTQDEEMQLLLQANDEATQAMLWSLSYRLATDGRLSSGEESLIEIPPELPVVPMRGHYTETARGTRLSWLRQQTKSTLTPLTESRLNPETLTGNIENLIGGVEVPVGVAGPLLIRGRHARGMQYAPMATTEGALVASASRGATAISQAGGVTTRVLSQRMMRVPMFMLANLQGATILAAWIRDHFEELREQTRQVSSHAQLVSVEPVILGNTVHVHFLYETGDAAGQNMTTSCTWKACQYVMDQMRHFPDVRFEHFLVEGGMSGDKKVTFQSLIAGRGIRVIAETLLPRDIVQKVLKSVPEEMVHLHGLAQAAAINSGMIGYNLNVANIIASIFTATGQDIACVHESSLAQFHVQNVNGDLYASMLLPSLVIGTVGGGTHLPAQQALLEMMGCAGEGHVFRLAEIIAGFCLALDLSTGAAIASGAFASAHDRLGRNRPVRFFTTQELTPEFFQPTAARLMGSAHALVQKVEATSQAVESSIVTQFTARKVKKTLGLYPLRLTLREDITSDEERVVDVLVKIKPLDEEVILVANSIAGMVGNRLASAHNKFRHRTGFASCHLRELAIYQQTDPRFTQHAPLVYQIYQEPSREAYVLVLELLRHTILMNTADDPSDWKLAHLQAALTGAAQLQSIWLGREEELVHQPWLGPTMNTRRMAETSELWEELAFHAHHEFPQMIGSVELEKMRQLIRSLANWWTELEKMPRTLIHNDFNPRNIALREEKGAFRLCAYDWEMATMHVPQHDAAELLCFVLDTSASRETVSSLVEFHRRALEQAAQCSLDEQTWRHGFLLSLRDLAVNRFNYYVLGHTFQQYGFLPHTLRTMFHLLDLLADW